MTERILLESDPHETRMARLEGPRLVEFLLERHRNRSLVGNIYKARVSRVLPGMGAAFLDLGLERDAFLYVADVLRPALEEEEVSPLDAEPAQVARTGPAEGRRIEELLRPGQEILVQVTKDPLPHKGARVTTHLALAGRYLVRLPNANRCGISRRIQPDEERERLRSLAQEVLPPGQGWIVRTVAQGVTVRDLERDRDRLTARWAELERRAGQSGAPRLLEPELDLAGRVVRDLLSRGCLELLVADARTHARVTALIKELAEAELADRVRLEDGPPPLFERFDIDRQLDEALRSRVLLPSGGSLVIHTTEALVAIDVNSGRFVGESSLEETALATNLEAVEEIVRQIRLRDLGGIIILDLIDMEREENRHQVFERIRQLLEQDRARTRLLSISEFGLVQMTRKRSRTNLEQLLTESCSCCGGTGRLHTVTTVCLRLRRRVLEAARRRPPAVILLHVAPEIARALESDEAAIVRELEECLHTTIQVIPDPLRSRTDFEVRIE